MVKRSDLLSFGYYKKAAFTGSDGKLRFRIEKEATDEGDMLALIYWRGPWASDVTPEEEKTVEYYPFAEESLDEITKRLGELVS